MGPSEFATEPKLLAIGIQGSEVFVVSANALDGCRPCCINTALNSRMGNARGSRYQMECAVSHQCGVFDGGITNG